MKKEIIGVPDNVRYLNQWERFQDLLPLGQVILNKKHTGCGASTLWLTSDKPTIITSPRTIFLQSKKEQHPTVHLFRPVKTKKTIPELKYDVKGYLSDCSKNSIIPKILVTYDSFKYVVESLKEIGCFGWYDILVDEMQCLFTDAMFKATEEISFLRNLACPNNIVFMSATPFVESYLEKLYPFCNMTYVELKWSSAYERKVHVTLDEMRSPKAAIIQVIDQFKVNGYFEAAIIEGKQVKSQQAVFFVNEVRTIMAICKHYDFTDKDVNILCSESSKSKLQYKGKFRNVVLHRGVVPLENKPHKTYTFVTKASFEGVDFYSPCCSTYVFSSPQKQALNLDISIDIHQILGRQRLGSNPFRDYVTIFYTTQYNSDTQSLKSYMSDIYNRIQVTKKKITMYDQMTNDEKFLMKETYKSAQIQERYSKDYVSVIENKQTGQVEVLMNDLVIAAELRAIEIRKNQYANNQTILTAYQQKGYHVSVNGPSDKQVQQFLQSFKATKSFPKRMEMYATFRQNHPDKEKDVLALISVPLKYPEFLDKLGADRIKALQYREFLLKEEVRFMDSKGKIMNKVRQQFVIGERYSAIEIAQILQEIYHSLAFAHYAAKATDIDAYVERKSKRITNKTTGKRDEVFEIISFKDTV